MTRKLVEWRTDEGIRHAIITAEGPKWLTVLAMGSSSLQKVPATEGRYMRDLDYPLEKAKKHFRTNLRRLNGGTLRGLSNPVRDVIRKTSTC